jgi:hypothetical protein
MVIGDTNYIKNVIDDIVKDFGYSELVYCEKIKNNLSKIFAENLNNEIEILSLKSGNLLLKCESSSWRYEINIRREDFVNKINSFFDKQIVKSIEMV